MSWRIWGEELTTTDMTTGVRVWQPITSVNNTVLRAIRATFIFFDDPAFDDVFFQIYSVDNNVPKKLLTTSINVRLKAIIVPSLPYGATETYFEFDDFMMRGGDTYALVPRGTNYVPAGGKHLSLRKGFPDPIIRLNVDTSQMYTLGTSPYMVAPIADTL